LSEVEPILFCPRPRAGIAPAPAAAASHFDPTIYFDRRELAEIFRVYGRRVTAGEWRDYALDFGREKAVFSVFRRTSEVPLYRIEKCPKLARRQGTYSVVAATGLIMKRGHDLRRVLAVLDQSIRLAVI
jgi:Protein of unknown function (DUF2794)